MAIVLTFNKRICKEKSWVSAWFFGLNREFLLGKYQIQPMESKWNFFETFSSGNSRRIVVPSGPVFSMDILP